MARKKEITAFFDLDCRLCPRLSTFLDQVGEENPGYHARPVAPFGDKNPGVLIVGLAPGMHGANATGRPFTGDFAGILLYQTLFKYGFSNQATSTDAKDGLRLAGCRITNAVKCLPPQNKPLGEEVRTCNQYLKNEIASLRKGAILIALGGIAHQSVLRALDLRLADFKFAHNALHQLNADVRLLDSYHCSRYNTQTKRLTEAMFHKVFKRARQLLDKTS
jgi:uracil-DNA glycosylase